MIFRALLLSLCALALTICARAEDAESTERLFRNWTTNDGLPHNRIKAIVSTHDGFLWVGTDAGLAKFDGQRFETFGLRDGLSGVAIRTLLEGRDGTLWVRTTSAGLNAFRNGRVAKTYTKADGLPPGTSSLAQDPTGHLWVSTSAGIVRLENDRFVPVPTPTELKNNVPSCLYCDRFGTMWGAFGNNGLYRWTEGKWEPAGSGAPPFASTVCEDAHGTLCVGDSLSLWRRESDAWRNYPLPAEMERSYIYSLQPSPDGTLWIAVTGGGVCGWRDGKFIIPKPRTGTFDAVVESVYATNDGHLWLGTYSSGLYMLSEPRISVITLPGGERANHISALMELAPGEFAVGTEGRGCFRWRDGQTTPWSDDPDFRARIYGNCFLRTRGGSIWVATFPRLYEFRDGQRIRHPEIDQTLSSTSIRTLLEDRTEGIWAGNDVGLFHIRNGEVEKVAIGTPAMVFALVQEKDGTIWAGTGNGLYRISGQAIQHFTSFEGIPTGTVRALRLASDGTLWIGTTGRGLAKRVGDRFAWVTTNEGLPGDDVTQITQDRAGRIWVGTNRGIAIVEKEEADGLTLGRANYVHPIVLRSGHGLLSESCMATPPVEMSDGRLAFATTRGIAILRPEDFRPKETCPPVSIGQLSANGRSVEASGGSLTLPAGLDHLEIEYTGVYFSEPEQLHFRHRLIGLDRQWVETGSRRAVEYSNLAPGSYRFEVSGSIGNGHWLEPPATLEITLKPHFWQTWPFQVASGLLIAGAVAGIARHRERRRTEEQIRRLERQHAVDAERSRIARDLHDDLGANLTQVALLSELAQSHLDNNPRQAQEHINEIFTTAQEVTRALDEIVWAVNPSNDRFQNFILFLCAFVQDFTATSGLRSRFEVPENLPEDPLDSTIRHDLYLATKEALNNIVKHAHATEVRLRLVLDRDHFTLTIEDDGRGFAADDRLTRPGADGLINLTQRLERLGGQCRIRSEPGQGTSVEMQVPQRHTQQNA